MRYTQITDKQVRQMLGVIGVDSVDELFEPIPPELRRTEPLKIPKGVSELELLADIEALAARNHTCHELTCFLGGGAYDHFIPSVVDAVASESEFVTAYTPYQAEASQGILQLFYEFQTMICMLTGMDVANSSLYEGATGAAEAATMAAGITRRHRIAVAESVHPDIIAVLKSYGLARDLEIDLIATPDGTVTLEALKAAISDATAAVLIQSPNYFGCIESLDELLPVAQASGALGIVSWDPLASGLLEAPGAFGADIVVGEGQPLGIPLQYGGPYLGLMACREKYLRKMPGRVVGVTRDREGRRGFCLALQTREQHIKRERATSNICTNQGLLAIRAAAYLATMGKTGVERVARLCFDRAHYAAAAIEALDGYSLRFDAPFFKEFTVRTTRDVEKVLSTCRDRGILAGVPLSSFSERYGDCFTVAVTEKRTRKEIDRLVESLREA